jgi:hypothetical protein
MSYNTQYTLTWGITPSYVPKPTCQHSFDSKFCPECGTRKGFLDFPELIAEEIRASENISFVLRYDRGNVGKSTGEAGAWYEHELDMKKISVKYSGVVFALDGTGEETGDIWRKYFFNGKMQRVGISFEPFDPNKLK